MKTRELMFRLAIAAALCAFCQPPSVFAQGSLTPPGAPAPTMKTLTQMEPRIAITNTGLANITQPGSYYLTANITVSSGHGINILTNNVTLDLNGFTVASTAPQVASGGTAILLGADGTFQQCRNITILNGYILGGVTNNGGSYNGPGFQHGIFYPMITPQNVLVSHVTVEGVYGQGILVGQNATVVEFCMAKTVGFNGISAAVVSHSSAYDCGLAGIAGRTAENCHGFSPDGIGISVTTANNCVGTSTSSTGLSATTANNCVGTSSTGTGLTATMANNCIGTSGNAMGLFANTAIGCYGSSGSSTGLRVFIANSCSGSGSPAIMATNKYNMP